MVVDHRNFRWMCYRHASPVAVTDCTLQCWDTYSWTVRRRSSWWPTVSQVDSIIAPGAKLSSVYFHGPFFYWLTNRVVFLSVSLDFSYDELDIFWWIRLTEGSISRRSSSELQLNMARCTLTGLTSLTSLVHLWKSRLGGKRREWLRRTKPNCA